jgi:arginine-tRNA-protein transferase
LIRDIDFPESVRGKSLDDYLARGWYRLGQSIFTTDYIPALELAKSFNNIGDDPARTEDNNDITDFFYRVYWLRFRLHEFAFGKKQQKLVSRFRDFKISFSPFINNDEIESLYKLYRDNLDFQIATSLGEMLYDFMPFSNGREDIYDTWMISIRYQGKLMSVGIFDQGEKSLAGIINFYDPAYGRLSPGKFLMLLKIRYAIEKGMHYYYPGYISPDFSKFDYKFFPGKAFAELYNASNETWYTAGDPPIFI